jgi:hypothetical protein
VRVGVDATSWANRRGYGRFARNVVGRLVAGEDEYVLFTDERTAREEELPQGALVRAVAVGRPPAADAPRSLRDLGRVAQAASRERVDVFLFPSLYTWFPVRGAPTVVGIHDVIAEQYPEEVYTRGFRVYTTLRKADQEAAYEATAWHRGILKESPVPAPSSSAPAPRFSPSKGFSGRSAGAARPFLLPLNLQESPFSGGFRKLCG